MFFSFSFFWVFVFFHRGVYGGCASTVGYDGHNDIRRSQDPNEWGDLRIVTASMVGIKKKGGE